MGSEMCIRDSSVCVRVPAAIYGINDSLSSSTEREVLFREGRKLEAEGRGRSFFADDETVTVCPNFTRLCQSFHAMHACKRTEKKTVRGGGDPFFGGREESQK